MPEPVRFTLTLQHVKLLRRMYVGWCGDEYGAPEIDPKRPYGNSSVELDIHEILNGEEADGDWDEFVSENPGVIEAYRALHLETQDALQIALSTGSLQPGVYERSAYGIDWKLVEESVEPHG